MTPEYYKDYDQHLIALDSIVFGFDGKDLNLLFVKRNFDPEQGKWSLMGGFLNKIESVDEAAQRILYNLTGLRDLYLEQLLTFGEVNRDPGARIVSIVYYALIKFDEFDKELVKKNNAFWKPINSIPDLVFDHNIMVEKAMRRVRRKARMQPIGFNLLPEKFTMLQLLRLYEAIYQKKIDKRNFSKKLLSMNILEKLDEKVKNNSKKGSYLYKFNSQKYNELTEKGFIFEL